MEVIYLIEYDYVKEREKGEFNRSNKKSCLIEIFMVE